MKKLFASFLIALCTMGISAAQDLEKTTEMFNNAAAMLEAGNKADAAGIFEQALTAANALGEEGAAIATQCKDILPKLCLSIGKELANNKDIDGAVASINKAIELAKSFEDAETVTEATELIPQLLMADATSLLNEKKFAEAAAGYKKVIDLDPENGMAYLRMGMALSAAGGIDDAVAALDSAKVKGQEEAAAKQLSNIFVKKAVACQKAKDFKGAIEAAQKSIENKDNANAEKILGLCATALKQNKTAAEAFEAYLALSPDAKDKVQIIYQLGTALVAAGDNGKACGYFKQIAQDAKFGEAARYQLTTLKCN